jgi:hypothetical protein
MEKSKMYCVAWLLALVIMSFILPERNVVKKGKSPKAILSPAPVFLFNSFVDCNMAEAWIGDTFRIFPGKYGEDPLWGNARDLKFADGKNADETFSRRSEEFKEPLMPVNVSARKPGLHGAVWFETIYQDKKDYTGKTLYAVYHNENYPATLPYDEHSGEGYKNENWPQGLKGPSSPSAVCRIGIMKSSDGGKSWVNKGIFIEDLQPRLILRPYNTAANFAGGVGDPSAVASGDSLYLFYGEYGYPGTYNSTTYDPVKEWSGQCISIARIAISDLDNPARKARRWDGIGFNAAFNGVGSPIRAFQIPIANGGGPASSPAGKYYWGPSVSWNTFLQSWVMLMARAEGPSWQGNSIYISFNKNKDLGWGMNAQEWSPPELLLEKPGHEIWYPSLQPLNTTNDIQNKYTCLKLGQYARLFFKDNYKDSGIYLSEYMVRFEK